MTPSTCPPDNPTGAAIVLNLIYASAKVHVNGLVDLHREVRNGEMTIADMSLRAVLPESRRTAQRVWVVSGENKEITRWSREERLRGLQIQIFV